MAGRLLDDLAEACRTSGLTVVEQPGWRSRGHGLMAGVRTIVCHHTAGPKIGDLPSLGVVRDGRADLDGPLSQLMLSRSGDVHVIASGLSYHAGPTFEPDQANRYAIGIEAEATGTASWPANQYAAYVRLCAALCRWYRLHPSRVLGHKEIASPRGRKSDPNFDMAPFRRLVADALNAAGPPAPVTIIGEPMLENHRVHGAGDMRLICPTGDASGVVARAWLSAATDGPAPGKVKAWFQTDTGGIRDVAWDIALKNGLSGRPWAELPNGCTQVNIHYDFPDGGTLCLEAKGK